MLRARNAWKNNVMLFNKIMLEEDYDLAIGDEVYEVAIALRDKIIEIKQTFLMIYDFVGADAMTKNPFERMIAYKTNYGWAKGNKDVPYSVITRIFIGMIEDVPDEKFGFFLPNRRESVKGKYNFVGYILPFNPDDYFDLEGIRRKLNYGESPLIICSVGGTSIGKPLLQLCGSAFPLIQKAIPGVKMILVTGPRISPSELNIPEEVKIADYLDRQYEHFAACDLAIVQGGSTTTLELTALQKPFIYFPIQGHFEQQLHVAKRLERLNAGIKMQFSETTSHEVHSVPVSCRRK